MPCLPATSSMSSFEVYSSIAGQKSGFPNTILEPMGESFFKSNEEITQDHPEYKEADWTDGYPEGSDWGKNSTRPESL